MLRALPALAVMRKDIYIHVAVWPELIVEIFVHSGKVPSNTDTAIDTHLVVLTGLLAVTPVKPEIQKILRPYAIGRANVEGVVVVEILECVCHIAEGNIINVGLMMTLLWQGPVLVVRRPVQ